MNEEAVDRIAKALEILADNSQPASIANWLAQISPTLLEAAVFERLELGLEGNSVALALGVLRDWASGTGT